MKSEGSTGVHREDVEIIANRVMAPGYYKMTLSSPSVAKHGGPGQFLHIKVAEGTDPLLRRPISLHDVEGPDRVSLLYRVVGRGTGLMSRRKAGETLDVMGPLGAGFRTVNPGKRAILVAGGMGVAPLFLLARRLKKQLKDIRLLAGAKTRDDLVGVSDFKSLGCKVETTTEDGTAGRKGFVTDIFEKVLVEPGLAAATSVYACGPRPMLARVATIAGIYEVPCQVSLEELMACGTGACLSCVTRTTTGMRRVCADGPVFHAGDIAW